VTARESAGLLVNTQPGAGSSAWIGLRVRPVPPAPDRAEALSAERMWLAAQWDVQGRVVRRFEVRYTNDPDSGLVTCTLLGVAYSADATEAATAAVALRDGLLRVPPHLSAEPILDQAELHSALAPFGIAPGGITEVRKRLTPVPGHGGTALLHPLHPSGPSWVPLWAHLAGHPQRAMVSVCLEPSRLAPAHLDWLRNLAREYARLADAGQGPGPRNPYEIHGGADPLMRQARQSYEDALRRYGDRTFRMRVSVAAEGPLPLHLSRSLADLLGGVDIPVHPAETEQAARDVRTVGRSRPQAGAPDRILADLVDLPEATAAFRLPYGAEVFGGAERPRALAVVLTALELEYQAVRKRLTDLEVARHPGGLIVETGTLPGTPWRVALAAIGPGTLNAAAVTQLISGWLEPKALFFVGVAGGLREEIALGDVVVATKIYSYEGGKETPDGFHARPEAWLASFRLQQEAGFALRGEPGIHFKPIAAGDVVLSATDSVLARRLALHYSDAVAVEMEGSGVAHAAHIAGNLPTLVIRGISDHADGDKSRTDGEGWQPRAADRAAAAALAVIAGLDPGA
jgi:nucleoside phosphorylase